MGVRRPGEASKSFEALFGAGDLDSGASITMNDSVVFEAGALALVNWSWTMVFPDGRTAVGATAEVLRLHDDGSWTFVIDDPDGAALIDHA